MILFFLMFSLKIFADTPVHWNHILEIKDKHEFYQNQQLIDRPKDSWQHLFSLVYIDRDFKYLKDCVFFRVPGVEMGILKIKTIAIKDRCDDYVLMEGDKEIPDIKSLSFSMFAKQIKLEFTLKDFKSNKWEAARQDAYSSPIPSMHLSSAEFKSANLIMLAQRSPVKITSTVKPLQVNTICHNINDECQEISPSFCTQCSEGWYEIPNGCPQSPKFCGPHQCGGKDRPACRRGLKWQKKELEFDCQTDSSFAYCSKGLEIACEGKKAFCR